MTPMVNSQKVSSRSVIDGIVLSPKSSHSMNKTTSETIFLWYFSCHS